MKISPKSSLVEVAFSVCTTLDTEGIKAVLTGGSAATFYAPASYQSFDLDFVITFSAEKNDGPKRLSSLGFEQIGDYYKHPDCDFPLEFPPGPLTIGDDFVTSWSTVRNGESLLHILGGSFG